MERAVGRHRELRGGGDRRDRRRWLNRVIGVTSFGFDDPTIQIEGASNLDSRSPICCKCLQPQTGNC